MSSRREVVKGRRLSKESFKDTKRRKMPDNDVHSIFSLMFYNHQGDLPHKILSQREFLLNTDDPSICDNFLVVWACSSGRTDNVRSLLQDPRVDPSARDNEAIIEASRNGHTDVVELLLQDGRVDPSAQDNDAFLGACYYQRIDVVKLLLRDQRVDPHALDHRAPRIASLKGHIVILRLLLDDDRIYLGTTDEHSAVIVYASRFGQTGVVELLLQDPRVDPSSDNNLALAWASKNGHSDVVKLLLQDSRVKPSGKNDRVICYASENGHTEVVRLLLKNTTISTSGLKNAIMYASLHRNIEIVHLLLRDPRLDTADVEITTLTSAILNKDMDTVIFLLGEPLFDPSVEDNVALHLAIEIERVTIIKLLAKDPRVIANGKHVELAFIKRFLSIDDITDTHGYGVVYHNFTHLSFSFVISEINAYMGLMCLDDKIDDNLVRYICGYIEY